MTAVLNRPADNDLASAFATHEVMNQAGALENYNAFAEDKPLAQAIRERILRADSATRELERWCAQHDLEDGRIVALCERDALPQRLDDNSMDTLAYPAAREHALFPISRSAAW